MDINEQPWCFFHCPSTRLLKFTIQFKYNSKCRRTNTHPHPEFYFFLKSLQVHFGSASACSSLVYYLESVSSFIVRHFTCLLLLC